MNQENNFAEDIAFLREHVETVVLENSEGAAIAVVPQYQGRTMTSCSQGQQGTSFGYINYQVIEAPTPAAAINLYGGEDRVWISPEGGQYSIFFDPQVEMSFDNWRTPAALDSEAFEVVEKHAQSISLHREAKFVNWTGTEFNTAIDRQVCLLDRATASQHLKHELAPSIQVCCHESRNRLTNMGNESWKPESGLIGVWMLCMSKPSPQATLLVPFQATPEEAQNATDQAIVNADYFGKLHQDRLQIDRENKLIYFLGDGQHRSKLGLTFDRVCSQLGSWDPLRKVLTIVQFNLPDEAPFGYNNNLWELQEQPYAGDVINCYNDGLNESGSSLAKGGFYELETISPALALAPGGAYTHIHRTFRLQAQSDSTDDLSALSSVAKHVFGVSLDEIQQRFA